MNIAQSLKKLMDARKLSNSKLAKEIGVHTSTVSNWLNGKDVKAENLSVLCEYFGCSLDYLVGANPNVNHSEPDSNSLDEELKFALWGDADNITDEDIEDVRRYAAFIAERKKKQK